MAYNKESFFIENISSRYRDEKVFTLKDEAKRNKPGEQVLYTGNEIEALINNGGVKYVGLRPEKFFKEDCIIDINFHSDEGQILKNQFISFIKEKLDQQEIKNYFFQESPNGLHLFCIETLGDLSTCVYSPVLMF